MPMLGVMADSYKAPAGGFNPITSMGWLIAYYVEGPEFAALGLADNTEVATWPDEVGTFDLPVIGTAPWPVYRTAISQLGNRPGLDCTVSGRNYVTTALMSMAVGAHSMVMIVFPENVASLQMIANFAGSGSVRITAPTALAGQVNGGTSAVPMLSPEGAVTTHGVLISSCCKGAGSSLRINGTQVATATATSTVTSRTLTVGTNNPKIAFLGIYEGDIHAHANWPTFTSWATTYYGLGAFVPTLIAGLAAWYDASDAASITSSAGAVSQWNDKSVNARHVTQATAANKPSTAVNTINGKNVLTFDGTNDCLIGPVAQLVNATTGEWSAFSVHKPSNVTGVRNIFDQDKGSAPKTAQFLRNNGTASNALAFNTAPTAFVDVGTTITINTAAQYSGVRTATTVELWVNGTSGGSTATTGTPSADGTTVFSVGRIGNGAQFWAGDIAEIIVYNVALSTTDRQAVENYLKAKWGTP